MGLNGIGTCKHLEKSWILNVYFKLMGTIFLDFIESC